MKKLNNEKGFTLVELMVSVMLLGIFSALAWQTFDYLSDFAKKTELKWREEATVNEAMERVTSTILRCHDMEIVGNANSKEKGFCYIYQKDDRIYFSKYDSTTKSMKEVPLDTGEDGIKLKIKFSTVFPAEKDENNAVTKEQFPLIQKGSPIDKNDIASAHKNLLYIRIESANSPRPNGYSQERYIFLPNIKGNLTDENGKDIYFDKNGKVFGSSSTGDKFTKPKRIDVNNPKVLNNVRTSGNSNAIKFTLVGE